MPLRLLPTAALTLGLAACTACASPRAFHLPVLYHVGFWVRDAAKVRAFYHDYLGFAEPYDLHRANGDLQMIVMKVNERQVIYLFPNPDKILPNGDNLDHLGLLVDHIGALHDYLVAKGIKVGKPSRGHIGDMILGIRDPDGHPFEVTELEPEGQLMHHQGQGLPSSRISDHLNGVTISVANVPASLRFYRDLLGFRVVSEHPMRLAVPDGTDYIEFAPYDKAAGPAPHAIPFYTLGVPSAAAAADTLKSRAAADGFPPPEAIAPGTDGKPSLSVVDPDGARVVLSE